MYVYGYLNVCMYEPSPLNPSEYTKALTSPRDGDDCELCKVGLFPSKYMSTSKVFSFPGFSGKTRVVFRP